MAQSAQSIVSLPYYQFVKLGGNALFNAKVYVGKANTDPTNPANQIDILAVQAGGTTIVITQPARTNGQGHIVDDVGNVAFTVVESAYSIQVDDQNDNLLYEESCIDSNGDSVSIKPEKIIAVTGQLVYPLTNAITDDAVVYVNGRLLDPFSDYDLVPNGSFFDLVLTQSYFDGEVILVFAKAVVGDTPTINNNEALSFIADIALTDLTNVTNFNTKNYDTVGDNGGAEWSFTGNTVPSKAGNIELATGNTYDINGREFVLSNTVLVDRQFGIKTSDQSANIHIDVTNELNNFIAFGRLRAAQDGLAKGGSNLYFTPRQELEKTGTLDLIDYYLEIDFNNTTIYQQDSTSDVINWEGNAAGVSNLWIRWADTITPEDFFTNTPAGFRLSGGQPIDIRSESVFSKLKKIWIWGGWDGFKLDSQVPDGGLFWQFIMESCYVTEQMNQAYNFVSIAQVSTTSSFRNCHAGCKIRDGVTHNGKSFLALQHMPSSTPIEPEVTVGWKDYWEEEVDLVSRPAWVSGVFYRTMGKGWSINNIQTTEMSMCSLDGAHNEQDGNVINSFNSVVSVGDFHLEGHTLSKADGVSMLIGSDCNFGYLYMFDLRLRCGDGNSAYLIGGSDGRNRNMTFQGVRNQNQAPDPTGKLKYINGGYDVTAFNAITCGSGVPAHLTFNMPDETHYDRPIKQVVLTGAGTVGEAIYSKGIKTYTVADASNPAYTVEKEDKGSLIQTTANGTATITMDRLVTPQGDTVRIVNNGTGTVSLLANGTGVIDGETTAASDKVLTVTRITDTIFFSEVSA